MAENHYYLTTSPDTKSSSGELLAVISLGSPQRGDENITVCDVERVKDQAAAQAWFEKMMAEKPWEPRN